MKDKIKNIAEKLEHQIRMHELDLNDRIKDIPAHLQSSVFKLSKDLIDSIHEEGIVAYTS